MRLPTMARSRGLTFTMLAATSLMLAACAGDATAPAASSLSPTGAQRALVGAVDSTYSFLIDPRKAQTLRFGASSLSIPAYAICDLVHTSYGVGTWNDPCAAMTKPVTIKATVRNAGSPHPSVEFQPALRFNPTAKVWLYMSVSDQATVDGTKVVYYCSLTGCVDESQTDADLQTFVDTQNFLVYRRIKHFSGYVVAEFNGGSLGGY